MVNVIVRGDRVRFEVEGWDQLWALKSQLEIPLAHVRGVRADPEPARGWWHGVRPAKSPPHIPDMAPAHPVALASRRAAPVLRCGDAIDHVG